MPPQILLQQTTANSSLLYSVSAATRKQLLDLLKRVERHGHGGNHLSGVRGHTAQKVQEVMI
jgi:hypothetical protein